MAISKPVPGATKAAAGSGSGFTLEGLMQQYPQYFSDQLLHRNELNVQVIYTQVNRNKKGGVELADHYFNVDAGRYFYPASTVKLPVALLALQKLHELNIPGLDMNSTMITEAADNRQTPVYNDPLTKDGRPSIAQYIKKILLVSDNDAFNRLYEFLGQEYINRELQQKGFGSAQILHRLSISLSKEENRNTNPITFLDSNGHILYQQPSQYNKTNYAGRNEKLGKGYYQGDQLINEPMDFSGKNRISLEDLHRILVGLIFPEQGRSSQQFNLTDVDKQFVLRYMSMFPTESKYPPYSADTANYWPAYCKFLLFGGAKGAVPDHIRIFNKTGDAYGQMVDVAYIVDLKNNIEFFLSAAIYCNADGILNDDRYDYETVGLPFMQHLGQVIYDLELKRPRKLKPDLRPFIFAYDK